MNVIDDDTFNINKNHKITVKEIGNFGHKIVVIDDFYENPDKVYDIINSSSYTTDKSVIFSAGVARVQSNYNLNNLKTFIYDLIRDVYFDEFVIYNLPFIASVYKKDEVPKSVHAHIHNDGSDYAFIVYMNKNHIEGGTSLWKHKKTNIEAIPTKLESVLSYKELNNIKQHVNSLDIDELSRFAYDELNRNHDPNGFVDEQTDWELLHLAEMKYNRFVLYPGSYFHAMHVTGDMYNEHWRKVQVGMLN